MKRSELLTTFSSHVVIKTFLEDLSDESGNKILKGAIGSSDALIAACAAQKFPKRNHVFILHDREEAAYFHNDLEGITAHQVLFFPTSYKRPYQFEEIDNANILQRTETLNAVNESKGKGNLIVTYPDALSEKVINKRSLVKNSFLLKVGEQVDAAFISELLIEYGFEKVDFVYEAGNFAIRGGIIDVFSYAHDLPVRIELFGKEVESIRSFDPETQLSTDPKNEVSIVPDLQTKLLQETRESLMTFMPKNTQLWIKDIEQCKDVIDKYFEKVTEDFNQIRENSGDSNLVSKPGELFIQGNEFREELENHLSVEFGNRFVNKDAKQHELKIKPQPSFNKDFDMLTNEMAELQTQGYQTLISSDSIRQTNRIRMVIEEHDPSLKYGELNLTLRAGFIDEDEKIAIFTDHQLFERFHKYRSKERHSRSKALTIKELKTLNPGDYVAHIDHGIGRFAGLERKEEDGKVQESVRIIYRDDDILYLSIHSLHKIAKYSGQDAEVPSISKLGSPEWDNKKKKVKKKVKEIAINLIKLYAKRKESKGFAFSKDSYLQAELETSFIYEDTPDQGRATSDVKDDMEQPYPMDRLVCGDVGFGKTEVAIRAAFKAVNDSRQVAVLVPTTILAMQHHKTFSERLNKLPCCVEFINRFRTAKEIKEILKDTAEGKVDILIGTHRIVGKDVNFKNLGLLIIDEEQKFGVVAKEKLKEMSVNIDVLTLTATPIPRTLQFSLMGARDMSIITTPPTNRQPVTTEVHSFGEEIIRDALSYELRRGGQVFFVHNRINDIDSIASIILRLVPDAKVGVAHGQMDGKLLERNMLKFIEHDYDILVSTNIIESGLDIPNANTIIINQAHMYGLSDLHQMRGRVGRSNKKAFCYLLTPTMATLTSDARKRLMALEEFSDLGDGLKISMKDLDIRGAGNLLGGEQSGFINDIGMETYQKLLEESVQELKETEFRDLFTTEVDVNVLRRDCVIETDLEVVIPDEYVTNISERLRLYNELDNTKNLEELKVFKQMLNDRFGTLPPQVEALTETVRLRWRAQELGLIKLRVKGGAMRGYVSIENNDRYFQSPIFGQILTFIQTNPQQCQMKELKGQMMLKFLNIQSIQAGIAKLDEIIANE